MERWRVLSKAHFPCWSNLVFALISTILVCAAGSDKTKMISELWGFVFITMLNNISRQTGAISAPR